MMVCSTELGCYGHGSCTTSAVVSGRWSGVRLSSELCRAQDHLDNEQLELGLKRPRTRLTRPQEQRGSDSEAPAWPWMSSGSTNLSAHFKGCNLWLKCHILGHTGGGGGEIMMRIPPCYDNYSLYFVLVNLIFWPDIRKPEIEIMNWQYYQIYPFMARNHVREYLDQSEG